MFLLISFTTPLVLQLEPTINGDTFLYPPAVVNGIPWWAFKIILLIVIPSTLLLAVIYQLPDDFPAENKDKIETEAVNVTLVPLTRTKMGRRSSYNDQNILIRCCCSSIFTTMEQL